MPINVKGYTVKPHPRKKRKGKALRAADGRFRKPKKPKARKRTPRARAPKIGMPTLF